MRDDEWTAMTPEECQALLGRHQVGRIAVVDDGRPLIVPVNYVLDDGEVVFRTGRGTKLDAALRGSPVAFEIDGFDDSTRTGWSVLVRGRAHRVTEDDELARVRRLPLVPWAPGDRPHFVTIRAGQTSGRRIRLPDIPPLSWG